MTRFINQTMSEVYSLWHPAQPSGNHRKQRTLRRMPYNDVNLLFAYKLADVPNTRQVLFYRNTPVHRSLNIVEALLLGIVSQILTWATDHIHLIATFLEIRKLVSDKIRENKVDVNYVKDIHKLQYH